MKREYSDPKKDSSNPAAMFSNLHRHLLQPPIHFQQHQHPFPFSVVDDESSSGGGTHAITTPKPNNSNPTTRQRLDNDGASIEVQRRPRGRPPGSKNRPKPPVIITRELPDPIMSPYILEISDSADIIDSVAKFSRRRNTGLCILHASGEVSNVTIRQPTPNSSSTVTFHGRFDILSLEATFLCQTMPSSSSVGNSLNVSVSLSIPQGQIIGGIVAGPLVAAGTVYVVAASFSNPLFQLLPLVEDDETTTTRKDVNHHTTSSGGNDGQSPSAGDNNNNGGGMYSGGCNDNNIGSSDVIWASTARQPF